MTTTETTTPTGATSPRKLRYVVIGVGAGIFNSHRIALDDPTTELVAVADINPELGQQRADELGCEFYTDHQAMLAATQPEVAIIVTPHPFHASLAIDCFEAGCHVLVEKPIAVQVSEADAMLAAAKQADRLLVVNYQRRFQPDVQAAKQYIDSGKLGQIQYVSMAGTWPRTKAYFDFADWRGTWKGEGGGLLMNQSPHDLDMLCYLTGLPSRVFAWTPTQAHNIETEDTATAILSWPNGATGSFHASTAESGLPHRFEIIGTGGVLRLERGGLQIEQFEPDMLEHIQTSLEKYRGPASHPIMVELGTGTGRHEDVYNNLRAAIFNGEPLIADGASAAMSLELANAMIYSNYTGSPVELPLDRQAYADMLADLQSS